MMAAAAAPATAAAIGDLETLSLSDSAYAFDPLLRPAPFETPGVNGDGDSDDAAAAEVTSSPLVAPEAPSLPLSSSEFSSIAVADPQKEHDPSGSVVAGSSTYVSYLVTSRSSVGDVYRVRRRFKDFVSLADRLAAAHRGLFIPARPDKSIVEGQVMQRSEFVEQRRVALAKYLCRLAGHPVIGKSDELKAFLRMPSPAVTMATSVCEHGAVEERRKREAMEGANVLVRGSAFFGMFKEIKQTVANGWVAVRPPPVEEEKDVRFLQWKERLQGLEQEVTNSSQKAQAFAEAHQDVGDTLGELGMTLVKLAKFETESAGCDSQQRLSGTIRNFSTAVLKASRLHRGLNTQLVKHLDIVHEYSSQIVSVHNAIADRSNALTAVQTLSADIYLLQSRAIKLEGDRSKYFKLEEVKEDIRTKEEAKVSALRDYEHIKENNRNEIVRFDKQRRRDLVEMMKGFIRSHITYSEKIANLWAAAAEDSNKFSRKKQSE